MKRLVPWFPAVALGFVAAGLWSTPVSACGEPRAKTKSIDVVICLDVSNSMDGLINSAKARLWDIVNDLARAKPTPNLRVALYSYGNDNYDPRIGWIRKEVDLTTDLDAISQKLFGLTTQGGTEYVTRVCRDAIVQQKWSEEPDALKIIFVCGNEPASQDPVVKLKEAAGLARGKGIIVNPIFCGSPDEADARDWKEYASLCGGKFMSINQDRGTVAVATPMDKELTDLSGQLNTTYLGYGRAAGLKMRNQAEQDRNAALAPGAAPARALSKSSGVYRNADWDLVDRLKDDPKFDVKKVPVEDLSDEMKKMSPEQREACVKDMLAKRETLQKKISDLSAKRTTYIQEERKKNPTQADKAFDDAVRDALRDQAKDKGIDIPK